MSKSLRKRLIRRLSLRDKINEEEAREQYRRTQREELIRMLNERQDRDIDLDGEV